MLGFQEIMITNKSARFIPMLVAIATLIITPACRTTQRVADDNVYNINGRVTYISITGDGGNSAEIVFDVHDLANGLDHAFRLGDDPDPKPQVFSATAAFLTAAYYRQTNVAVGYRNKTKTIVRDGKDVATDLCVWVAVPSK